MANDLNLRVTLDALDRASGPMRAVANSGGAMAESIRKASRELQALKVQQRDVSALRLQVSEQQRLKTEWHQSTLRVRELAEQQARAEKARRAGFVVTSQAMKAMQRDTMAARAEASRLKDAFFKQGQAAQATRDRLTAAGISTRDLADHEKRLRSEIERTSAAMQAQGERLRKLGEAKKAQAALAAKGAAVGVGGAMVAAGGRRVTDAALSPVDAFKAHEDAMLGIARQVPGARDEMGKLTEVYRQAERDVRSLSEEIPLATTEIANMMTASARMEVPTEHLRDQVKLSSEMAIAFDAVPEEIAESMGKVGKNFKIPITEMRALGDAINYLDDNAISKGADIINFLQRTSGVMNTVAISEKNAAALGSTLLTLGETRETASTASNAIVQRLAAAEKGKKPFLAAMKEIGLSSKAVQKGMQEDAKATMDLVFSRIRAMPKEKQTGVMVDLFGFEHSDTAAKLVGNPEELKRQYDLANSDQAKGSMSREFAARADTMSAKLQIFENQMFNLKAAAGETLVPALTKLIKTVSPMLVATGKWVKENPKLVGTILAVTAALGTMATIGGTLAMGVGGLIGLVAMLKLGMAMVGIATGVAVAPILAVVGALGLLVGAGALIYANWDAIKAKAPEIWAAIKSAAAAGFAYMGSLPQRMWQAGNDIISGLINGVTAKLGELRDTIVGVASKAAAWFRGKLDMHSPSRLFMQYGGWVSEGAALGIQAKAPMVARAAAAMAALPALAAAPALATPVLTTPARISAPAPAAGGVAAATAAPIHITINAAPGMDPQAIARAVAAELDNRARGKQSRGYSKFGDR